MANMQFKGYVFKYNPAKLEMSLKKNIVLAASFAYESAQNLKARLMNVTGEGEFFGGDCENQAKAFKALFEQDEAGLLSIPGYTPFMAHFSSLKLLMQPGGESVRYTFGFIEESTVKAETTGTGGSCCAKEGESVWDIAARYDIPADALLALNPGIDNPASLPKGREIRLG